MLPDDSIASVRQLKAVTKLDSQEMEALVSFIELYAKRKLKKAKDRLRTLLAYVEDVAYIVEYSKGTMTELEPKVVMEITKILQEEF